MRKGTMFEIQHATLPDGSQKTIRVEGGCIVGITEQADPLARAVNARGTIAVPGLIDPHVHFRVPGGEHKEDWLHGVAAARAGGVTMVFDMPNTDPPLTTLEGLHDKIRLVGEQPIDYRFWFGSTPTNMAEIQHVAHEPMICGVKTYLGSSTGDLLVTDDNALYAIAETCAEHALMWAGHCEDEALMRAKRSRLGRTPTVADHCRIRDTLVELTAVRRMLQICADVGCRAYLVHLSAPESVEAAFDAKERGLPVAVEVCPHHVLFSDHRLCGPDGPFFKVNPPLRTPQQALRLRELLSRNGFVETVATDHAPHAVSEKHAGVYDRVPSGVPGVENRLAALFDLVVRGELSLQRFVDLTSRNAAQLFGLATKGEIAVGRDADIVLINPKRAVTPRHESTKAKCGWTPYDSMTFQGDVERLFFRGTPVPV